LAAEVGDALSTQKGKISLYACPNGTLTERSKFLPMLLAIQYGCLECGRIKILGYGRQTLKGERGNYGSTVGAVKSERTGSVIHMVILNTVFNELADYLGERHGSIQRALCQQGDFVCIHIIPSLNKTSY